MKHGHKISNRFSNLLKTFASGALCFFTLITILNKDIVTLLVPHLNEILLSQKLNYEEKLKVSSGVINQKRNDDFEFRRKVTKDLIVAQARTELQQKSILQISLFTDSPHQEIKNLHSYLTVYNQNELLKAILNADTKNFHWFLFIKFVENSVFQRIQQQEYFLERYNENEIASFSFKESLNNCNLEDGFVLSKKLVKILLKFLKSVNQLFL